MKGFCSFCKDMIKFGGLGRAKQTCVRRQCYNVNFIMYYVVRCQLRSATLLAHNNNYSQMFVANVTSFCTMCLL